MRKLIAIAWIMALVMAAIPVGVSAEAVTDYTNATAIVLGTTSTVKGTGAAVSGSTIKITAGGNYTVSGTLANGSIEVNTTGKVYIELNGVNVTNAAGPALMVTDAKRITLTLKEGTTSYLTDGANANENDAAVFTNDTLEINGTGTLVVDGKHKEGISSDDDIIITSGTLKVTSKDDGLNAHDDITVNGGYVYIVATGDGIDSNGTVNINGGTVISMGGTTGGEGGLDARGLFTIKGGTLIATGNTFTNINGASTQSSLLFKSGVTQASKSVFSIKQGSKEILTYAPARTYQNVLYSSPDLSTGTSYSAVFSGSSTGKAVDGLYTGGVFTAAAGAATITATAVVSPAGAGMGGAPSSTTKK